MENGGNDEEKSTAIYGNDDTSTECQRLLSFVPTRNEDRSSAPIDYSQLIIETKMSPTTTMRIMNCAGNGSTSTTEYPQRRRQTTDFERKDIEFQGIYSEMMIPPPTTTAIDGNGDSIKADSADQSVDVGTSVESSVTSSMAAMDIESFNKAVGYGRRQQNFNGGGGGGSAIFTTAPTTKTPEKTTSIGYHQGNFASFTDPTGTNRVHQFFAHPYGTPPPMQSSIPAHVVCTPIKSPFATSSPLYSPQQHGSPMWSSDSPVSSNYGPPGVVTTPTRAPWTTTTNPYDLQSEQVRAALIESSPSFVANNTESSTMMEAGGAQPFGYDGQPAYGYPGSNGIARGGLSFISTAAASIGAPRYIPAIAPGIGPGVFLPIGHDLMYNAAIHRGVSAQERRTTRSNPQSPAAHHTTHDPELEEMERVARYCRKSGTTNSEATSVWRGDFVPSYLTTPDAWHTMQFSQKVFVGGIPFNATEEYMTACFKVFGPCEIQFPSEKPHHHKRFVRSGDDREAERGYAYVIYKTESAVKQLLQACQLNNGQYEYFLPIGQHANGCILTRPAQIIPWNVRDAHELCTNPRSPSYNNANRDESDPGRTVFIGALYGQMTAEMIARAFNDKFGGVVEVTLDTDRYRYPIGSGRVVFDSPHGYENAWRTGFLEVKTPKFRKTIQIDPFIDDKAKCSVCNEPGLVLCRQYPCFAYLCKTCWKIRHSNPQIQWHPPLMRNIRHKSNGATRKLFD